jgi:hypothetical protein
MSSASGIAVFTSRRSTDDSLLRRACLAREEKAEAARAASTHDRVIAAGRAKTLYEYVRVGASGAELELHFEFKLHG